ncbi:MAG: hypothetical protein PHI31_05920 [Desulfuromonadaceae bacterium]|nr:hypothetical protein [Desulfuromonadaceae bacterium]
MKRQRPYHQKREGTVPARTQSRSLTEILQFTLFASILCFYPAFVQAEPSLPVIAAPGNVKILGGHLERRSLEKYQIELPHPMISLNPALRKEQAPLGMPIPVNVTLETIVKGTQVYAKLTNRTQETVTMRLEPGSGTTVRFNREDIKLAPGEERLVPVGSREYSRGRHVLHLRTSRVDKADIGPGLRQVVEADNGVLNLRSFKEAFARKPGGGWATGVTPQNAVLKAIPYPTVQKLKEIKPNPSIDPRMLKRDFSIKKNVAVFDNSAGLKLRRLDYNKLFQAYEIKPLPFDISQIIVRLTNFKYFQGYISFKTDATTYKAGWGWNVRAIQNGVLLGETYADKDGRWVIPLEKSAVTAGVPVTVAYRSYNPFMRIEDDNGNVYTWADDWDASASSIDVGSRYADLTTNGDLPGVAEIYEGGARIWNRLAAAEMAPGLAEPFKVLYPNTTHDCGGGSGVWSCSWSGSGEIWIVPQHANQDVIAHELGHSFQITANWGGWRPAGAGGAHNSNSCYNKGLAFTEGFATFFAFWSRFDIGQATPNIPDLNGNIEKFSPTCTGATNESSVAALLWDFYDSQGDWKNDTAYDSRYYIDDRYVVWQSYQKKHTGIADWISEAKSVQPDNVKKDLDAAAKLNGI